MPYWTNTLDFPNLTVKGSPVAADVIMIADSANGFMPSQCTLGSVVIPDIFPWTVVGVNTNMSPNNGYLTSSGGTLTMTLPATTSIGDIIRIANLGGNFTIAQRAGQSINFGNDTTTSGVGGSITSTNVGDVIELVTYNANTNFMVLSSMGNLTFV